MAITYTPATNFGAKDTLPTNDPAKVIKGAEFTTEFNAIQTAFASAAPAASPFFTGTASLNGTGVDAILDEDNMASDSDTALATQQSIKAYVDTAVGSPTVDLTPSVDNSLDLGSATKRWADLYLSGGIYIGGTTSANYLDDYEEGTFTLNGTGSFLGAITGTVSSYYGQYTKVGRKVYLYGVIKGSTSITIDSGTSIGYVIFGSMPFAAETGGPESHDTTHGAGGDSTTYGFTTNKTAFMPTAFYATDWSWGATNGITGTTVLSGNITYHTAS